MLKADLKDARVIDLFAGTGALGLEAISRGAATADFVERGDRATGDNGEVRGQRGDGNEAQVGTALVQLGGALRRRSVVERVAFAEFRCAGFVFEIVEERGWVQEGDGCDAEHNTILGCGWSLPSADGG